MCGRPSFVLDPTRRARPFLPNQLPSLAAWYRYGKGITSASALVSAWADQSGNARDLLQATGTNQPTLEADGSITFDGVDNFLKTATFTLNVPVTIYYLGQEVTWTANDELWDGFTANSATIYDQGTTPNRIMFAGSNGPATTQFLIGTDAVLAAVYNGASSLLQVNNNAPSTGDPGTVNLAGFTLGAGGTQAFYSNSKVKEVILFPAAHDAATRARVIRYLMSVGGIA